VSDYRTVRAVENPDFVKLSGLVGADQHGHLVTLVKHPECVAVNVKDLFITHPVPVGAWDDDRIHQ
jgi:hypothetical protein